MDWPAAGFSTVTIRGVAPPLEEAPTCAIRAFIRCPSLGPNRWPARACLNLSVRLGKGQEIAGNFSFDFSGVVKLIHTKLETRVISTTAAHNSALTGPKCRIRACDEQK